MRRVLFVDDDPELLEHLKEDFHNNAIEVITCENIEQATTAIENDTYFDVVILDWFFENPEESIVSRLFLARLKNKHFRPVFVYTNNLANYEQSDPTLIDFPANLIKAVSKDTQFEDLRNEINLMLEQNISLQLASTYRNKLKASIEKVLFDLNELPNADLGIVLKKIVGNEQNIDWSSDLILNLIHRYLLIDEAFANQLQQILQGMPPAAANPAEAVKRNLVNKILYFHPHSQFIRNGDIVRISNQENTANLFFGIVATPDCDLVQPNTRFIEIIELRRLDDATLSLNAENIRNVKKYNHPNLYYFPSVKIGAELIDFVAVLKSKFVAEENPVENNNRYPQASVRLLYSHSYRVNSSSVRMHLICGKSNPYKAEFFQKLHASNSRIGIPDIKDLF
jgi:CheY-like chemotaxis protein